MSTRSVGDAQNANTSEETLSPLVPNADVRHSGGIIDNNQLSALGEKIFLDRYALKDMRKRTLAPGDTVIVCVDTKSGQREIGTISKMDPEAAGGAGRVSVKLKDGTQIDCLTEHVSKPIETVPEQMME